MSEVGGMRVAAAAAIGMLWVAAAGGVRLDCGGTVAEIDDATAAIGSLADPSGKMVAKGFRNLYFLMTRSGDVEADEGDDRIVSRKEGDGGAEFVCANPKLPGLEIVKFYRPHNGGLRRTLTFRRTDGVTNTVYVTPFTKCAFDPAFQMGSWHLGAGYIGPYKPFPAVKAPRPVNDYKQSSKGLVFVHPGSSVGGFSHFRVKIDDTVVLPWWHSTIGHYREYHDRLWYLPDGYKMGLGTFDIRPGKSVSVTDQFTAFDGDLFTFFDDVFAKDADIAAEFATIPPPPKWLDDVFSAGGGGFDDFYLRWMSEMTDDGLILGSLSPLYSWGDYRGDRGYHGDHGGFLTLDEVREMVNTQKSFSPRIRPWFYSIVISTSFFTGIYAEHPEWFRPKDRDGNRDSLFPGQNLNWQTMFNHPDCRAWLVDMLCKFTDDVGVSILYLDETQMTNTIDWEHDCVTRDSDTVKFWKSLKGRLSREGKLFYANGSGCPYADLNYMESPHELAPSRWRDWAGVGWGIGMMNRMRPGQRACPLYWTAKCDYANRILALGWIPSPYYSLYYLPIMRATYQTGNMLPANVRYTPDWKRDAAVEVESHSVKRADARDVLISFINRAAKPVDVPVEVDLSTLGFGAGERINVWRMHLNESLAGRSKPEIHSDAELKRNWRERGIVRYARITDPELVYSGAATGTLRQVFQSLGTNRMDQLLATASPAAIFAENGLPLNYPYTAQRHARIDEAKIHVERDADILLADRAHDFTDVTVDGKPVKTRSVSMHGLACRLVHLEKGDWTLGWRETPRPAGGGKTELPAPLNYEKSTVRQPSLRYEPEELSIRDVNAVRGGVKVTRAATWRSKCENSFAFQTNLSTCTLSADVDKLTLVAGTSRRNVRTTQLETFAGFELEGARQMHFKFSHTFGNAHTVRFGHVAKYGSGKPSEWFTGLIVDYSVGGKYAKRVSIATGLYNAKYSIPDPSWGTGKVPDERLDLGEWIDEEPERTFSLDISKFAPKGWDGRVFLSLGTSHVECGRSVRLEILSFNDAAAGNFVSPEKDSDIRDIPPPLHSRPLRNKPKSLIAIDTSEWRDWARIDRFFKLGEGKVRAVTRAYVAHDYEYLYVGVEADQKGAAPNVGNGDPVKNDHMELFVCRPDKLLYQILGDPKERTALYIQGKETVPPSRLVCRGETVPGKGWNLFFAVPIDDLKFDMQRTPVTIRANVCRVRRGLQTELSAWTPLEKGFYDTDRYGTVILDFDWSADK